MKFTKKTLHIMTAHGIEFVRRDTMTKQSDVCVPVKMPDRPGESRTVLVHMWDMKQYAMACINHCAASVPEHIKSWIQDHGGPPMVIDAVNQVELAVAMRRTNRHAIALDAETSSVMHMDVEYLGKPTRERIKNLKSLHVMELPYEPHKPAWLVVVPDIQTLNDLPLDLHDALSFASAMGSDFALFMPDGPRYEDIRSGYNQKERPLRGARPGMDNDYPF